MKDLFFFSDLVLKDRFLNLIYKTKILVKLLKLHLLMIIDLYLVFPVIIFLLACMVFISNRKHLLITLLRLEYIVLRLFLFLFIYLNNNIIEIYFLIVFLVFSVCEGALGLSILVSIIRTHGNNYFQSFNTLIC